MRVVGLDLSMTATGVATINRGTVGVQTIKSKPVSASAYPDAASARAADLTDRSGRIAQICCAVLNTAAPTAPPARTDLVVLEGPSFASTTSGMWDRAWLWGRIVDQLLGLGVPIAVAAPTTVKLFAAGKGNANKTDVAAGMTRLWPDVTPTNDNEFDALALASMGAQWLDLDVPRRAHHQRALDAVWWPQVAARTPQ